MKLKRFDNYSTLMELEEAVEEFSSTVEIIDVRYQTIVINGEEQFTATASYDERGE